MSEQLHVSNTTARYKVLRAFILQQNEFHLLYKCIYNAFLRTSYDAVIAIACVSLRLYVGLRPSHAKTTSKRFKKELISPVGTVVFQIY